MSNVYIPNLLWGPLCCIRSRQALARLEGVLASWEGSSYESGASVRGVAADCIGSIFGILDDLDAQGRGRTSPLPHDAAMHNRAAAMSTMRELITRYRPNVSLPISSDGFFHVQPGDIVATGYPNGGPGHVEMVGTRKNTLWHALPESGFHQTGFGLLEGAQLIWRVYRVGDRWRWSK